MKGSSQLKGVACLAIQEMAVVKMRALDCE